MKSSFSWRRLTDRLIGWSRGNRSARRIQRRAAATRRLVLESLEERTLLSGSPFGAGTFDMPSQQAPSIDYSILLHDDLSNISRGIVADSSGNSYIAGYTTATMIPGNERTNAGGADAVVAKLDSAGGLLSNVFIGGSNDDYVRAIALDSSGGVYITGTTLSPDFPGATESVPSSHAAFVSKLTDGKLSWTTFVGNLADGYGVTVASSGDIYVTGNIFDPEQTNAGSTDVFVSKLSSEGKVLWSALLGGSDLDFVSGIAADSSGNVYISGNTHSSSFTGTDQANAGQGDVFVSKLNSDGAVVWSTLLGGEKLDYGEGIALDPSGNVYITGTTQSANFPGVDPADDNVGALFVSKLDSGGKVLWSIRAGDDSTGNSGIAVDSAGNAYVAGTTKLTSFPGTDQTNAGGYDPIVFKLNPDGVPIWSIFVGGSGDDSPRSIALDAAGDIYLTGRTTSSDFPGPNGTTRDADGTAGFVVKLNNQDATNNPTPVLTGLSQTTTSVGSGELTLTINGSGFIPDSVVKWNDTALTTSYVSEAELSAVVPADLLAEAGSFNITVVNPEPGGGISEPLAFTVMDNTPSPNPTPVLTGLSQSSIDAGSTQFTLTVNGSDFVQGSVVKWNGTALATTYVSDTELKAVVTAELLATAGSAAVTVVNPEPGGGTSEALTFTVTEAPPNGGPTDSGTPPAAQESILATQWNGLINFYRLLNFQYFVQMGVDPLSSLNWGAIFAQFEVNLGIVRQAAPLESLILFKYFLDQGGDPYLSGIVATSLVSQGSIFTPATGSPSERAAAYYDNLGLAADGFTDYYASALGYGLPDDAIAALIAAQHGKRFV